MRLGDYCGIELSRIACSDDRIWVLDGDLADSDGAVHFAREHPDRFIMAGAAEQCMVSIAAGMASCGARPWVFSFAAFLCYRAYDQIRVGVSQARLPVTLVGSHSGGCGGRNGKTHLALNDIALMASLPGIQVWSPASPADARCAVRTIVAGESPAYLRLPRQPLEELPGAPAPARWLFPPGKITIIASGFGTHLAVAARKRLLAEGVEAGLLHCARIWPLPEEVLQLAGNVSPVAVVEDHYNSGGLSTLLKDVAVTRILSVGWSPGWSGKSGGEESVLASQGLDPDQICKSVCKFLLR